nr:uncharacterized protein LOC116775563 [Danaus plexippus plexippus]
MRPFTRAYNSFIVSLEYLDRLQLLVPEPALEDIEKARTEARSEALHRWKEALANPTAVHRTIAAFRPVLEEWVGRHRGSLTFRLVQILTGHGCFGHYLHLVARREETPQCHHCGDPDDTADHTMVVYPAWQNERRALTSALGGRMLSLPSLVEAMIGSDEAWEAAACFAEAVMSAKEAAEREREVNALKKKAVKSTLALDAFSELQSVTTVKVLPYK